MEKMHNDLLNLRATHDIIILQSLQDMSSSQVMLLLQCFFQGMGVNPGEAAQGARRRVHAD